MNSPLTQPLQLPCGQTIKNRFGKSAMTEGLADSFDRPTSAHNRLYSIWSSGGAGLHITGNVMIDRRYLERAGNVVLENDSALDYFKSWARAGTEGGNHLWMQISHPGRQCPSLVNTQPLSPSDVQLKMLSSYSKPRALKQTEIEEIIQRFAITANLAKRAGFTHF